MRTLITTIQKYLEELCVKLPHRHVGSAENRAATAFFAKTITSFGFETECPEFDCIDWEYGDVLLHAGDDAAYLLRGDSGVLDVPGKHAESGHCVSFAGAPRYGLDQSME
jgi:hypothetical protein